VFPVYIIHMVVLFSTAYFVVNWELPTSLRFIICFVATMIGSFLLYEAIRRIRVLRPLFGITG